MSGTSEPRPSTMTAAIALTAARIIARDLARHKHINESEVEDVAQSITHRAHGRYTDGYAIGKALDDREGYEINFEMCEILNGFSGCVTDEINRAEKEWAARVQPQPPLAVGSRVVVSRTETGEITGIYEYGPAKYLVKIDNDPDARPPRNSRRIIDFEDARAIVPVIAPCS